MWTRQRREQFVGYLFIAPQLAGVGLFVLVPLALVGYYSLHEWNVLNGTFTFVGAANFQRLADDQNLLRVLTTTGIFSVALVAINIPLALSLALLLNRKLRGITFFRTVFFSPVVVSLVAWTIVWRFLFQNDGGINGILSVFGVTGPNWLREGTTALIALVVVQVFKNVGLNMVLFLAALQAVPRELLEAAEVDGAGAVTATRRIVIPLIAPTILLALILTVAGSLQVYAQIAVLTQGGPGMSTTVLVYYLVQQVFEFHRFGYGSTLAIVLFAIVMGLTLLQWRLRRRWVFHES